MSKDEKGVEEVAFTEMFSILWKGRSFIFLTTAFCILLGVIYIVTTTPLYRSSITLYSVYESSSSNPLSVMAKQFGVLNPTAMSNSNYNIPDVVRSRTLAEKIIIHKWNIEGYDKKITLSEFFDDIRRSERPKEIDSEEEILEWKKDKINSYSKYFAKNRVSVSVNPETNLIKVSVDMEQPKLARDIANFISLFATSWVNENQRISALKDLEFINTRLDLAESELAKAENELKAFKETNRNILNSPDLQLELQRLQRQVLIKQEVYLTLVKQKEIVQIEENRTNDVVRIVDNAIKEKKPYKPNKKVVAALSVVIGFIFSSLVLITSYLFTNGFKKYNIKKYLLIKEPLSD